MKPLVPPAMLAAASGRLGAEEDLDDDSDVDPEVLEEARAEKEAKARATILEMVGDLPDADCAPPENVLFVCKLNPVTTDEDLEIIFSRFGKVRAEQFSQALDQSNIRSFSRSSVVRSSAIARAGTPCSTPSSSSTTPRRASRPTSRWTTCS